jgi:hypothetical protein
MVAPATISAANEQPVEGAGRRTLVPRWVGVMFPLAILGGVGLVVLQAVNRTWLPFVVVLAGSAGLGLLMGLIGRRSLRHRPRLVRWAVAVGGLTVGLLVAGIVSGEKVGLGPLLPAASSFRWTELAQLALGGFTAWLAVRAFSRPSVAAAPDGGLESASEPARPNWAFSYHPTIYDTQPIRSRRGARPRAVANAARRPSPSTPAVAPRPPHPLQQGYRRLRAGLARASSWRPALGLRLARGRPSPIRFTGTGEDRCPYCLDIVAEHDRRGVTTCPVCHTRHHAECWAVTGTCQMPHLYGGRQATRTGAAR